MKTANAIFASIISALLMIVMLGITTPAQSIFASEQDFSPAAEYVSNVSIVSEDAISPSATDAAKCIVGAVGKIYGTFWIARSDGKYVRKLFTKNDNWTILSIRVIPFYPGSIWGKNLFRLSRYPAGSDMGTDVTDVYGNTIQPGCPTVGKVK